MDGSISLYIDPLLAILKNVLFCLLRKPFLE